MAPFARERSKVRSLVRPPSMSGAKSSRLDSQNPDRDDGAEHGKAGNRPARRVDRAIGFRPLHHGIVPVGHGQPPGDCLCQVGLRRRRKVQTRRKIQTSAGKSIVISPRMLKSSRTFPDSVAMTPQKLIIWITSLTGGAVGLFAPVGIVKWLLRTEPEDAGI